MVLNAAQRLVSAFALQGGWAINATDRAMTSISGKIVSNYAIVRIQEHAMHKTVHALVVQAGSVKFATQNAKPECSGLIVRKSANVTLRIPFIAMGPMAVVSVRPHGEVSFEKNKIKFLCITIAISYCHLLLPYRNLY